ncbi:MAG: NUDIX domain-containing protein [candidate division NC10 bacterium]|nr:NUDIX domain-containing protein [candidate division NC10 bacterium]
MKSPPRHIHTSVVAVIMDEEERVLLTQRNISPFKGKWALPGGKIVHGEAIVPALQREVEEEVGLEIKVDQLIDVFEVIPRDEDEAHYIVLYYLSRPINKELRLNYGEVQAAAWVSRKELSEYDTTPGTRHLLTKVFQDLGGQRALR